MACCRQSSVTVWRQGGAVCSWDVERVSASAPGATSPALAANHVVAAWADGGALLIVLAPGATRTACWRVPGAWLRRIVFVTSSVANTIMNQACTSTNKS